jgi:hypothetical protein
MFWLGTGTEATRLNFHEARSVCKCSTGVPSMQDIIGATIAVFRKPQERLASRQRVQTIVNRRRRLEDRRP